MERVRLKNIIILILALLNLFLLGSMAVRHLRQETARNRLAEELSALFAADGITLDAQTVPASAPLFPRTPIRSTDEDRAVAAFFLGEALTAQDEGGGIFACRSETGEALFRSSGTFELRLKTSPAHTEDTISSFCSKFDYRDLTVSDAGTCTAVQYVDGSPAADAEVTFHLTDGLLTAVTGIHLPRSEAAAAVDSQPISAATALTIFLQERRSSGAVVSAVTDVYACYRLHSTAASPMALAPAWCVVTDTGKYYVNSITGAVTLS